MLSQKTIDACEHIDDIIFNGDCLYENKDLVEFEVYLAKWVRQTTKIREVLNHNLAGQANI